MILYDALYAPSPRRVRMVIAEKGVVVDRRTLDLRAGEHLGESFRRINPLGTVPVLIAEGVTLTESAAICRYLDAIAPEPPLFGTRAIEQALVEQWCRRVEEHGYRPAVDALRNRARVFAGRALPGIAAPVPQIPALIARAEIVFDEFVRRLDEQLQTTEWIAGDRFSFADIAAFVAIDFAQRTSLVPDANLSSYQRWCAAMSRRRSAGV